MSEVRTDPLSGESVIVAPVRDSRPHSQHSDAPRTPGCPFCPGHEDETPPAVLTLHRGEPPDVWFVRVFPNLYPIVAGDGPTRDGGRHNGPASGVHEVIVETPLHDQEMAQRSPEELALTLLAYRQRLNALQARSGIRYVSVFHNKGPAAGASLAHPHSQAVALSYVPGAVAGAVRRWRRYHRRTGRCLLCDELQREQADASRVVLDQDGFLLYVPRGAAMSGELVLAPWQHAESFGDADDDTLTAMSVTLLAAMHRLRSAFEDPAYNLVLQTWPKAKARDAALHWYLRIIPRRAVLGGFELATGDFVSTLAPEAAAAAYRRA